MGRVKTPGVLIMSAVLLAAGCAAPAPAPIAMVVAEPLPPGVVIEVLPVLEPVSGPVLEPVSGSSIAPFDTSRLAALGPLDPPAATEPATPIVLATPPILVVEPPAPAVVMIEAPPRIAPIVSPPVIVVAEPAPAPAPNEPVRLALTAAPPTPAVPAIPDAPRIRLVPLLVAPVVLVARPVVGRLTWGAACRSGDVSACIMAEAEGPNRGP